mmetsp:Transcript_34300/g.43801  ORF Transcript_34300/g.43801 Transcript_34300/m.43801 type:complete len:97 (+) Transcript_34300:1-291(+)
MLAVARSFGDHCIKSFVIAEPSISVHRFSKSQRHGKTFIILACDGVWDVISDENATQFVLEKLEQDKDLDAIAKELVTESINRGSTDNITALIVEL